MNAPFLLNPQRAALLLRESPPLARRDASSRPASFNPTARTIEVVFATGAGVQRTDERGQFFEVLSLDGADLEALRGGSVLNAHNQFDGLNAVIGNVLDAWREGDQLIARLQLSERPELEGLVRDIGAGVIASVSVGYEVEIWQDGESNGQRTRTATKWRAREISFVPVSADPAARTRGASSLSLQTQDRAAINRQIRSLGTRAGVGDDVINDLVDRGASLDDARNTLFDNLISRGAVSLRASSGTALDDPAVFVRAAAEGVFCRMNPGRTPSGPARQFAQMPLSEVARECLRRSGQSTTGLYGEALVTRALGNVGGLITTSDFGGILGDVVGRVLRDAYQAAPAAIKQVARQTTAPDFRTRSTLTLDFSTIGLEKVGEHGEIRNASPVEAAEAFRIDTFARMIGLSRQAIVNDDLGAFNDLTRRLGQAAAAFEAKALCDLVQANDGAGPTLSSDGKTVFHADHHNIVDAALDVDGLDAARLTLRTQTSLGGGLLAIEPRWLVVGAALETQAQRLLSTITPAMWESVNPFAGALKLVVDPRLRPDFWYVVGEPTDLEYAHLSGFEGPRVEAQPGWRILGVEYRIYEDWGCGYVDWRSWVRGGTAE